LAFDASGNLFIGDSGNNRVRKISVEGIVTTVAGTGKRGNGGDGKLATKAPLAAPNGGAFDGDGNLYIADAGNNRLRKMEPANVIHTIAGGAKDALNRTGDLVHPSLLLFPAATAILNDGAVLVGDNLGVRRISADSSIELIAGNGKLGALATESKRRNDL